MGKNIAKVETIFHFCDGGSCKKAGGELAVREARAHLRNEDLWDKTHTIKTLCNGRCENAPTWIVQPGNNWYKNITPEKAIAIVDSHAKKGEPYNASLLYTNSWERIKSETERSLPPIVFKPKNDSEFGDTLVARGFASDQYTYPLLKKLFAIANGLKVTINNTDTIINNPHKVIYTDTHCMEILGESVNFNIAIGAISKAQEQTLPETVINSKLGVLEVIWHKTDTNYNATLRLKNRKGKHLVSLAVPANDKVSWNYILKTYLKMDIDNPKIEHAIED